MSSTVIYVGLPEDSKSSISKSVSEMEDLSVLHGNHRYGNKQHQELFEGAFLVNNINSRMRNELGTLNEINSQEHRGVPNAPKSCIAEIFSADTTDLGSSPKNGISRPRVVRDTPTRPRDTHSRLFGQAVHHAPAPMVTDTIRSNIQFSGKESTPSPYSAKMTNGSASTKMTNGSASVKMTNGSASSTPSREGNPITGLGYTSMRSINGEINTVTTFNGRKQIFNHNRVPPGGHTTRLW